MRDIIRRVLLKLEGRPPEISWAYVTHEVIAEGGFAVEDNDLVDGKPVKRWPVGVHKIRRVKFADGRVFDWPEVKAEIRSMRAKRREETGNG